MAEQAKQPKPKAQGRISPTEALRIMMTRRMVAPRGVQRLTEAMHDEKCHIWRDGKLVPRAEVGHLSVLENYDEETGQYDASIGDDRWDAVRGEYELEADEVMELLQKAEAASTTTGNPQRHKPGRRHKDDWPLEMVPELIRIAHHPVDREMLGNLDGRLVPRMEAYLKEQIGWAPQDSKAIREKLVFFLQRVR